jgi:putative addiction module component (TIGR02574 family)
MARTLEEIRVDASQLTAEERGALADSLWESLLTPEELEIQQAWIDEAERRIDEIRAGKAKTIPWEDVRRELIEKYAPTSRRSKRRG